MSTNLIPVERVDDQFVNLLVIYNALNVKDRQSAKLVYARDKTLQDYMEGLTDPEMWSVCVNAEPYHPDEWSAVYPKPEDYITAIPIPYGGGDSKNILRMVAMIAIAVAAPYAAAAMLGTTVAAVGTTAGGMALTAGITAAGGMLVNALLPPPKPSTNNRTDAAESPTYGIDGAKNTRAEDVIIPLIYGEYRYPGNFVNVKTENRGKTQVIYAQAVVSEGEIESIDDFTVNDQPIANYEDISTVVRLGTGNQSIVGWFASSVAMVNKGVTLTTSYTEHTTQGEIDGFRVDVVLPMGLSNIDDKDGDRYNRSVSLQVQYRKVGASTWMNLFTEQHRELTTNLIPVGSNHLRVSYSQSFTGNTQRNISGRLYTRNVGASKWNLIDTINVTLPMTNGYGYLSGTFSNYIDAQSEMEYKTEWTQASPTIVASARYSLSPTITAKTSQPLRRSFQSGVLSEGVYEIRVCRTNTQAESDYAYDKVVLSDIAEIVNERVRYNHTAFYGVRVRLTDQLNGLPKLSARVKGIKVPHYNRSGTLLSRSWSANPAWIVLDMLTNKRYGAGLALSRIDIPMYVEWAEFCDQEKLYFNGVIDTFSNIWDACQLVLRVGHARFTTIGNILSLSIYRASEPVMMFGSGNIIEGSLNLNWQSLEDRSNEFEIEYYDRNNKNKQNSVRVVDEEALARGEMQRISTTRMVGIDNQKQALNEAHFQKALNQALVMSGKFDTTIEALACGVGDVVLLQHDMPEWGESGRILPGSTATQVIVDRPLTLSATGVGASLLVLHPAVKRGDATVSIINQPGNTIYLTAPAGSEKAKRLKHGTMDSRILSIGESGGYIEVVLESVSGIAIGEVVELWDVDVIESRSIQAYDSTSQTITPSSPLSVAPQDFANYMIGTGNTNAKPVSIVSIDGDGEYKRTISFIEYNETVFTPQQFEETPIYTTPVEQVGHIRDLRIEEELTTAGGTLTSNVIVMWNPPADGNYAGAIVHLSRNGSEMAQVGVAYAGSTTFSVNGKIGDTMIFKVVAYDGAGRSADEDSAPAWMHMVLGASAPPKAVTGFKVDKGIGGIEFSWDSSKEIDVVGYDIREGAYWESGTPLVENFSGNRFFTTRKAGGLYTYHIKAVDALGNYSEQSSSAILSLPAPTVVMGFSSVQNGDNAILEWRRNPEVDIAGYEIRSGSTWSNSQHVVFVSGTSYTIPVGATAIDSYLIKAYDTAGVESSVAARVNQQVYRSQSYNAVHVVDATAEGYLGSMMGFTKVAGKLEGEDATETSYGEYVQPIEMEARYNAMVTTQELVAAKSDVVRTWADMRFNWMSSKAATPWFSTSEGDDLSLSREISLYVGQQTGEVVAWPLHDETGTPEYGTGTATIANTTTTSNGRYGHGLLVNPTSTLEISVSAGNLVTWWMRPTQQVRDVCEVVGSLLNVHAFVEGGELIMSDGTLESRTPITIELRDGWNYFTAVSVQPGKVLMFVRCLENDTDMTAELDSEIGSLSGLRFV